MFATRRNTCIECNRSFRPIEEVLETACNHKFHRSCLLACLKREKVCPECKRPCTGRDTRTVNPSTGTITRSKSLHSMANKPIQPGIVVQDSKRPSTSAMAATMSNQQRNIAGTTSPPRVDIDNQRQS